MESEFTAQSPLEGARSLKKSASLCDEASWLENMGELLCAFTASLLRQEVALHVFRVRIGTPGKAVEFRSLKQWARQNILDVLRCF